MKIDLKRTAAVAAVALVGSLAVGMGTAQAATTVGSVIGPAVQGSTGTPFSVRTTAACPAGSTNRYGVIDAAGWNAVPAIGADVPTSGMTSSINMADNLTGLAQANGVTLADGNYTLTIICEDGNADATGQFVGSFVVSGSGANYLFNKLATSIGNVSVTPPSPQNVGTPVNVSVAFSGNPAGSVQFKDNGNDLGSAVAVAANATAASLTGVTLTGPSHSLTAVFTPTDAAGYTTATSATPTSYTIITPAVNTSIAFGATTPASPTYGQTIVLKAVVSPAAAGTVTFKEGSTTVGSGVVNTTTGEATASIVGATQATHTYSASFVPSDPSAYNPSSTTADEVVVVGAPTVPTATENITVAVAAGTLTITAGGQTVDLGTLALNSSNTLLASGTTDLNTVTVTDTRAGSLGWNVNGIVGEFSNAAGDKINSANLGWTPRVLTTNTGQTVTPAAATAPAAGVAVGATSTAGLQTAKSLASSPAGASVGTATVTAGLLMQAPTTTKPGQYNSVLTLTAV
ncbi:hypothetical protein ACIB24_00385 [Spongisporangium articulatum]|uniref:Ig-like domain (Group 3) n=1 Tax=Spongisporangium articulatum TaxID=3362603 RepID=A0ABW8AIR6_9ACTN